MSYRNSHVKKGKDYDDFIKNQPFDAYMASVEAELLTKIITTNYKESVPRYLDFASGTGRIIELLEKYAKKSISIDISKEMQEQAKKKCKVTEFICADITQENISIEPVDLITAFRFFGNAENNLRMSVLKLLNTYLKENGMLVINNHRNPLAIKNILHRITGGNRDLDLSYFKLRSLLEQCGFKIIKTYAIGAWILRDKYAQSLQPDSKLTNRLESAFRSGKFSILSPDMIIVAKKI